MDRDSLLILFSMKVTKENGHWLWQGTKVRGYGRLWIEKGKTIQAHRLSLHLFSNLDLDTELQVNHKCNRKDCVNPEHLYVGTQADNVRDYYNDNPQRVNQIGSLCSKELHMINSEDDLVGYSKQNGKRCKECGRTQARENWRKKNGTQNS